MANSLKVKHKILLVIWHDAESIDAWTHEDDIDHSTAEIHSIGFLIEETKDSLTLSLNYDTKNGNHSCFMKIPKGMIIKRKVLKG